MLPSESTWAVCFCHLGYLLSQWNCMDWLTVWNYVLINERTNELNQTVVDWKDLWHENMSKCFCLNWRVTLNKLLYRLLSTLLLRQQSVTQVRLMLAFRVKLFQFVSKCDGFSWYEQIFWLRIVSYRVKLSGPDSETVSTGLLWHWGHDITSTGLYAAKLNIQHD